MMTNITAVTKAGTKAGTALENKDGFAAIFLAAPLANVIRLFVEWVFLAGYRALVGVLTVARTETALLSFWFVQYRRPNAERLAALFADTLNLIAGCGWILREIGGLPSGVAFTGTQVMRASLRWPNLEFDAASRARDVDAALVAIARAFFSAILLCLAGCQELLAALGAHLDDRLCAVGLPVASIGAKSNPILDTGRMYAERFAAMLACQLHLAALRFGVAFFGAIDFVLLCAGDGNRGLADRAASDNFGVSPTSLRAKSRFILTARRYFKRLAATFTLFLDHNKKSPALKRLAVLV